MSASLEIEKATLKRVQDRLLHLRRGLTPFVQARMSKQHGANWLRRASRATGSGDDDALDAYGLTKTILDNWRDVFDGALPQAQRQRARNLTSTAFEARNTVSHLALPLTDAETIRYLDAMHHLLRLAKAPEADVTALNSLYEEQRKSGLPAAAQPKPAAAAVPVPAAKLDLPPPETARALKPWTKVALPHTDILDNRFKESEFAADLFAVDAGLASETYATPEAFFRSTFLTEGLKRVLSSALERLAGRGGDPVIGLQTAFGGGKTHTILAVYHLARHLGAGGDPATLPGLAPLVDRPGKVNWPKPACAVFVGSSKGTDLSLNLREGPNVRTVWGFLAWRLAGEPGWNCCGRPRTPAQTPARNCLSICSS